MYVCLYVCLSIHLHAQQDCMPACNHLNSYTPLSAAPRAQLAQVQSFAITHAARRRKEHPEPRVALESGGLYMSRCQEYNPSIVRGNMEFLALLTVAHIVWKHVFAV